MHIKKQKRQLILFPFLVFDLIFHVILQFDTNQWPNICKVLQIQSAMWGVQ